MPSPLITPKTGAELSGMPLERSGMGKTFPSHVFQAGGAET